jgi:hypothetical protein
MSISSVGNQHDVLRMLAVEHYLDNILNKSMPKGKALLLAAQVVFNAGPAKARCIRLWTKHFKNKKEFPSYSWGKHVKTKSLVHELDIQEKLKMFLRNFAKEKKETLVTVNVVRNYVNNDIIPEMVKNKDDRLHAKNQQLSESQAARWMAVLGWEMSEHKKDVYVDGHDREDVKEYSASFSKRMLERHKCMEQYVENDAHEMVAVEPDLKEGERKMVHITHDESCFCSSDSRRSFWIEKGSSRLAKKGRGSCIMVSQFLCPCHGEIKFGNEYAWEIIIPGKNQDGYWTGEHVAAQLKRVIPIAEKQHPNTKLIFTFDNSSNHDCVPKDGLDINKITLKPKAWKDVRMRDGFYRKDNQVIMQSFYHDANAGDEQQDNNAAAALQFKGAKVILQERGIWPNDKKFLMRCPQQKCSSDDCCAFTLLKNQEDFKAQASMLEETVRETPHQVDFFAKFHCETNFIERYWAYCKQQQRQLNPTLSYPIMKDVMPNILSSCPLNVIRRYSNRCWRYLHVYSTNIVPAALANYAVKKYKSHRRIPVLVDKELEKLTAEYHADQKK